MLNPDSPKLSATTTRLRMVRVVPSRYIASLLLFFLLISTLAFYLFTWPAVADELAPAAPGSIAGTIKDSKSEPQAGIGVTLYQFTTNNTPPWRSLRTMTTQADGQYRFTLLPAGLYRVGATDPQKVYAPTYYPAAPTLATAKDLSIVGNQLTQIDVALQLGGTLTGVVMVTGSLPITEGYVDLYQEVERNDGIFWESIQRLPLPTTGVYSFTGLSALPYRICANVVNPIFFWYECYLNASIDTATSLTVTPGATISNINLLLGDAPLSTSTSRIGGRVTSLANEPLAGIEIYVRPLDQTRAADQSGARPSHNSRSIIVPGFYLHTDQDGNYLFDARGRYVLYFRDPSGQYAYEYYKDTTLPESATVVEVAENVIITDLNIQLEPASHLDGYVTLFGQPAPDGYVSAEMQTPTGWQYANSTQIDSTTGHYNIGGLPTGIYRVSASSYLNGSYGNLYVGYFGGNTLETATPITLAVGVTKTADITLTGEQTYAGSVSGRVTQADGTPVVGAKVYLYPGIMMYPWMPQPQVYVFTDAEGRYVINGLTTNLYWLGVVDPTGAYATTYYPNFALPASAGSLYIEDGIAFTETNMTMPLAGAISGRVVTAKGVAVANLRVAVYAAEPTFEPNYASIRLVSSNTRTDAEGRYLVPGLHPASYYVCFTEVQSGPYGECFGQPTASYFAAGGRAVNVIAGATTSGVDLFWGPDLASYLPLIAR